MEANRPRYTGRDLHYIQLANVIVVQQNSPLAARAAEPGVASCGGDFLPHRHAAATLQVIEAFLSRGKTCRCYLAELRRRSSYENCA